MGCSNGHVASLTLNDNQLSGEIPDLPDTLYEGGFGYNALTADPFGDATPLHPDWADTQRPLVDDLGKSASSITVNGLTQGANYYFIVKTTTLAHANNQNDVTSVASDEVLVVP